MSAPRRFPYRRILACVVVALAAPAFAQAPLPPPRPASLDAAPSNPPTDARPVGGAAIADAGDYTPVTLPAAPRARMHACGVEWRRKKMNNETGGQLWREFARACLTR